MLPTILLADDHLMISKGLRKYLEMDFGYRNICSVTSCHEIMNELKKKTYTHLVLDLGLSDGSALEILPNIKMLHKTLNILVYSGKPASAYERGLRQYGIDNFLSKEASEEDTFLVLSRFFHGEREKKQYKESAANPFSRITAREMEILSYMLQGKGTVDIATTLNIKKNSVSGLKGRIFEKTRTKNLTELYELAALYNL
jgi:DNA-binding NarL/FixJ family response regulator